MNLLKPIAFLLIFCLSGCAYTVVKDAKGNTRFRTMANIKHLTYQDETTRFVIEGLNHSLPSIATGKAISGVVNSAGSVIAGGATGAILVP